MDTTRKPLIVVLGLGEMGVVHAENLSKIPSVLLGIASSRDEQVSNLSKRLHPEKYYTSYEEALQDPQVVAVVISTPPVTHPEMITKCAQAKKHIFCEKPLGTSSKAISNSLRIVRDANIRFMAGFQRRWDPSFTDAKLRVDAGSIGKLIVIKCTSGDPEYPEKYHRNTQTHSLLLDLAVHDIDLVRWITASEVATVYAVVDALTYPNLKQMGDNDVCVAILQMHNGTKVVMHLSRALSYGYNVTTEIMASAGTLKVGDLRKNDVIEISQGTTTQSIQWDYRHRFKEAFEAEMQAFAKLVCARDNQVEDILQDNRYASDEDGLRTTIVAEALVKSATSGVPETVVYDINYQKLD